MIVFDLGCDNAHCFEGWFSSAEDFERQLGQHLLGCPICACTAIRRLPSAAHLNTGKGGRGAAAGEAPVQDATTGQYANFDAELMKQLISRIIENTENVGRAFPEEARKIHYKEAPERHIRGIARPQEVEALREEGIDVVALPVPPHLSGNTH